MNKEGRKYTSKVINIQHNHGNIIHNNHGDGTQPTKDLEDFKKHRVNERLTHHLLSMVGRKQGKL